MIKRNLVLLAIFVVFFWGVVISPPVSRGAVTSPEQTVRRLPYSSKRAVPSGADRMGRAKRPTALESLPVDTFGLVDWVQAVKQIKIRPAKGDPSRPDRFYEGTIIYNALNPEWGDVIFEHDLHTYHIDCNSCHPDPFPKTPGTSKILMMNIKSGYQCGKCHGKIAFPVENCERCHVLPKVNIKW